MTQITKESINEINDLIANKKFKQAIEKIQLLLKDNPKVVTLFMDLGFIYTNLNQFEDAIKSYEQVIEIIPNNESGYTGLGFVYRKKGELEKAAENFTKSLNLKQDNAMVYFELGETYFDMDEYQEAIENYHKAIQFGGSENDIETLHRIAQCNLGLLNFKKAQEIANQILTREPNMISAYNILGTAAFIEENWQDCIKNFEKYLEKMPNDEAAHVLLIQAKSKINK